MLRNVMIILVMLLSTLGPCLVIAWVGYGAVKALGRNPSAGPRILISMILAFIFAEAIAIIALLIVFNLFK
jgi:F-type H+-transporting ATPase subunit c